MEEAQGAQLTIRDASDCDGHGSGRNCTAGNAIYSELKHAQRGVDIQVVEVQIFRRNCSNKAEYAWSQVIDNMSSFNLGITPNFAGEAEGQHMTV